MSKIVERLRYSKDHEWVRLEGEKAYVGITDHAQHELGEIVFVEGSFRVVKLIRFTEQKTSVTMET